MATRYKLGKTPARPGAMTYRFGSFFNAKKLPVPPKVFGHESIGKPWGMLANDKYSNCVFVGAAHETMMWGHAGRDPIPDFTVANVLADYAAVTGFNPADPDTDVGTDVVSAASYRRQTGVVDAAGVRHKIDSYVSLKPGAIPQIALACYLTGAVGIGLQMPETAEKQFDEGRPWSVVKGSEWVGGHYVPMIGRNSAGNFLIVTWGRLQAMTPDFLATYMDEGVAYLSLAPLENQLSPEGFDIEQIRRNLAALAAQPRKEVST